MANPKHLKILKQGVKVWNKWRDEYSDVIPDLRGAYLDRAQLAGVYLNGASLIGTHLMWADLTGAHLTGSHLAGSHLSEAQLSGARLTEANLIEADLRGADLKRADLKRADLKEADLTGADLAGADLKEANLTGAYLYGANLTGTLLFYTNFSSARVAHTDFTEARLMRTILVEMDLSEARGLETVSPVGPYSIGAETILLSKGEIPEAFLRGAGISDEMILYIRTLRGKAIDFYSCFISYSHKDKVFARRLHDTLQGRGIRCWLDEHQLLPGDKFFEQIDRGIKLWDKVLLCCSEAALKSWWVNDEIERALAKEQRLMRERGRPVLALIPLDLDGHLHNWDSGKAEPIRSRLAPSFEGWEHDNSIFEEQVERVVKALVTEDAGRQAPPLPRL